MRPLAPRCREQGFSLLEVLVAFTVLALTLGVLLQIFSKAMMVTVTGADFARAAQVAEGRLARVGLDIPLEPGVYDGEPEQGVAWTLRVDPYELGPDFPLGLTAQPFLVVVDVLWTDGAGRPRHFSLSSLRLGAAL